MAIAITLKEFLDGSGLDYDVMSHEYAADSMRTAATAHVSGENLAKSVLLEDEEGYMLAVIPATHHVHLGQLRKRFHRVFGLASEKMVHELFSDCQVGAMPPVGDAYGIRTIVDDALNQCSDIYFTAGDHKDLIHLSGEDFNSLMADSAHGRFSHHV